MCVCDGGGGGGGGGGGDIPEQRGDNRACMETVTEQKGDERELETRTGKL